MKNNRKKLNLKSIIITHVINNKKEYIIILLLFIIGLFFGVMFVNNVKEEQFNNISNYLNSFVEKLKSIENIDSISLLKTSIIQNLILAILLWFFGTTVIRNTSCFRPCNIQRFLPRVYNFGMYKCTRYVKRTCLYI